MFSWFTAGPFGWAVGTNLAADRCDSWSDSFLAELLGTPCLQSQIEDDRYLVR
jgi:hypothetical protein